MQGNNTVKVGSLPRRSNSLPIAAVVSLGMSLMAMPLASSRADNVNTSSQSSIAVPFTTTFPGLVTLVIETPDGKRVRNLISETPFPAGSNVAWWDGLDDLGRNTDAAKNGTYYVPGKAVRPGRYHVRGVVRPPLSVTYELNPYTNGSPPWRTANRSSDWLANHTAPSAVLFVPAGSAPVRAGKPASAEGQILVGSAFSEGDSGLAWLDRRGNKLWGQEWVGGVWTGATQLARDQGPSRQAGVYAYAASSWPGNRGNGNVPELRLQALLSTTSKQPPKDTRLGNGEDIPVLTPSFRIPKPQVAAQTDHLTLLAKALSNRRSGEEPDLSGLAVYDDVIVVALQHLNKLIFIDPNKHSVLGTAMLSDPRGLTFDHDGRLLVLSGKHLLRLKLNPIKPWQLPEATVLIEAGLEDPRCITVGQHDRIYVSDWGSHHQVLVFSAEGEKLFGVGHPGEPGTGPYDPHHMNHPAGVTIDDEGQLWVAENDKAPKRVSLWNADDGRFLKAFYGPTKYGGGGSLDGEDRSSFYYGDQGTGIAIHLDWENGSSVPTAIYYRESGEAAENSNEMNFEGVPDYPLHHAGQLYLTNAYNAEISGRRSTLLWRLDKGVATAVAAAGSTFGSDDKLLPVFRNPTIIARMPPGVNPNKTPLLFIWSDSNGDGKPQPIEVQFLKPADGASSAGGPYRVFGAGVGDDLSFTIAYVGSTAMRFPLQRNSSPTRLNYDISHGEILAHNVQIPTSTGGGQVLLGRDGWTVFTTPPAPFAPQSLGGAHHGAPIWSYPSLWPGLHASHNAPTPESPGELIGTTRVLGLPFDAPPPSDAGQLWAINGNHGNIYLFTIDGLFVATIFQDARLADGDASEARRGMDVSNSSIGHESFYPSITRASDGHVYLVAGTTSSIMEIHGLERMRRIPTSTLNVTSDQLRSVQPAQQADSSSQSNVMSPLVVNVQSQPPSLTHGVHDWSRPEILWHTIDKRGLQTGDRDHKSTSTDAAVVSSADKLFIAIRTDDAGLLNNSGESLPNLFKTGGAIDFMLGSDPSAPSERASATNGDERLLVSRVKNKTVAIRYRPKVRDTKGPGFDFGSPLRTIHIDQVDDVSNEITLSSITAKDGPDALKRVFYQIEIPYATLGLPAGFTGDLRGDIGVLRGNGYETVQRVYWSNRSADLVSDVPSEAELTPKLWGVLHFSDF